MKRPNPYGNNLPCWLRHLVILIAVFTVLLSTFQVGSGQSPFAPNNAPGLAANLSTGPIPLGEVVAQAEAALAGLRDIDRDLKADPVTTTVDAELPELSREIDERRLENIEVLSARPSLETLRGLETEWKALGKDLPAWQRELTLRANELGRGLALLDRLGQTWSSTLDAAAAAGGTSTPPEILERMRAVIEATKQTRARLEAQRAHILILQSRVAEQVALVNEGLAVIEAAHDHTINQLLSRDGPAIWNARQEAAAERGLVQQTETSIFHQWASFLNYARHRKLYFALHLASLLLLIAALYWARRRVRPWAVADPGLERVVKILNLPVATALVLAIVASAWIYPQAPRLWADELGAAALIPTIIVLRQLLPRQLYSALTALVVLHLFDLLENVAAALPYISRLLFLGEMLAGIGFALWIIRANRSSASTAAENSQLPTVVLWFARTGSVVFAVAFIADVLGFVSLGNLLGTGFLGSTYMALILYATVNIIEGLGAFAARVPPLSHLRMIEHHSPLIRRRCQQFLMVTGAIVWVLYALELFSVRRLMITRLQELITAQLKIGAIQISLGNVLAFAFAIWAAFIFSRFLRFVLQEDVYPRAQLAGGMDFAVSTVLHYVVLLVGFLFAVAALGIDMTKFTILAGAFGVGFGFGLQNIVNNFVSGLILLFERPVKVGDTVKLGEYSGDLKRIDLRASVIATGDGSEVIVPNGNLISKDVVNWTHTDRQRRIEINVGVAYGTDPEAVIELLTATAAAHPDVLDEPVTRTIFVGFGDSALNFQLRAWTARSDRWTVIKSELSIAVNAALRDEGIAIPFPQRELHFPNGISEVLMK